MRIFNQLKEPVFLKETSSAKDQLEQLKKYLEVAPNEVKSKIEQDIKILTAGINGEDNIIYELKNSHMPMYVLHDIYLEYEELSAQIDFLVITKKKNIVIECKNLIGNIEIDSMGNFIRTTYQNGKYRKEGIYSPITQNKRHLELIKQIRLNARNNALSKAIFEKYFYENYGSVVVLANHKTVLNVKESNKEVLSEVIRSDQLIEYIQRINDNPKSEPISDKQMEEIAQLFLSMHKPRCTDFISKYNLCNDNIDIKKEESINVDSKIDSDDIRNKLKDYRLAKSREEKIPPYYIFNDKQLDFLIEKAPKTLDKLIQIQGFGEVKCKKYGNEIIDILWANS